MKTHALATFAVLMAQADRSGGASAERRNRCSIIFGNPIFSPTDGKVYPNERTGESQKKLANVLVPLLIDGKPSGLNIRASVYGVKPKNGKQYAQFKFFGANMQTALTVDNDPAAQADLTAWRTAAAELFVKWRTESGVTGAASKTAATGPEIDDVF